MVRKKKKIELSLGDIFNIALDNGEFAFARVIAKDKLGDVIEVFNYFSRDKNDYEKAIKHERLFYPHIIDSYSIFYIGEDGFELVKKHNSNCELPDISELKYKFGTKEEPKFYYLNGKTESSVGHDNLYPWYSPQSDFDIRRLIAFWRNKLHKE